VEHKQQRDGGRPARSGKHYSGLEVSRLDTLTGLGPDGLEAWAASQRRQGRRGEQRNPPEVARLKRCCDSCLGGVQVSGRD
jgi:hypothetical protein